MGLISKRFPVGIDVVIDKLQRDLFIELLNKGWRDYDSYHRAYRNTRGKDVIPEAYTETGEYKEVLFNDEKAVTSFFITEEKRVYNNKNFTWTQDVGMIFQANLSKLLPERKHRADEEMIDNIRLAIKKKFWQPRLDSVITGVDKVYDSLKISYDKKYFDDMNNFCVCRFNFNMVYTDTDKTQPIQ